MYSVERIILYHSTNLNFPKSFEIRYYKSKMKIINKDDLSVLLFVTSIVLLILFKIL